MAGRVASRFRFRPHNERVSAPLPSPPKPADVAWVAAIALIKATILALAADAFVNSESPRFRGKAMRIRAIGYTGVLLIVPIAWRVRGRGNGQGDTYPRGLDLAVALPLLADASANAVGIYERAHVDDAIHFANTALATAVVGAVVAPRERTAWEAAGIATMAGIAGSAVWEMAEWIAMKLGADGMDLTYDDTMADLIEGSAGAVLGGVITLLRHPTRLRQVPGRRDDPIMARAGAAPG